MPRQFNDVAMAKKRSKSKSSAASKKKASSRRGGTRSNSPWAKASKKATTKKKAGGKKKATRKKPARRKANDPMQRLQRVMAAAGIGSRRECETIIEEGRVEVDGEIVVTLGTKVDPAKQKIKVDGDLLRQERLQYFMLNKPPGVLSTSNDPSGRMRVIDLIMTKNRVYNVGRLDQSSEGLILVTNDGELANRLTHPRYGVEKKYHVQVVGRPDVADLKTLVDGVYLAEGKAKATSAKFIRKGKESSWIEITLTEGRNREIRRLLARIGHKVRILRRVAIGPLRLGELPAGAHRELTLTELKALRKAVDNVGGRKKKPVKKKATRSKSARSTKASTSRSGSKSAAAPDTRRKGTIIGPGKKKKPKKAAAKKKATKRKPKPTGSGRRGAAAGKPIKKKKAAGRKKARGKKR